ncbi:MAG TPA: hypothetical protein VFE85_09770 [Woeseiaceae bacterium]|nr:hypothetical protein [Woeseiaceae bacterium]
MMKCEHAYERLRALPGGTADELETRQLEAHLESCDDCRAAARADDALRILRERPPVAPPAGLFERVMRRSRLAGKEPPRRSRFWLGAGVGAALAASLTVAVMSLGLRATAPDIPAAAPVFQVVRGEPHDVDIAIDMQRDLTGAVITVALRGGIELDGYAGRRELSWTTDLKAGINRLSLPIVATDDAGGRLMVRVHHGGKERRFAMDVLASAAGI